MEACWKHSIYGDASGDSVRRHLADRLAGRFRRSIPFGTPPRVGRLRPGSRPRRSPGSSATATARSHGPSTSRRSRASSERAGAGRAWKPSAARYWRRPRAREARWFALSAPATSDLRRNMVEPSSSRHHRAARRGRMVVCPPEITERISRRLEQLYRDTLAIDETDVVSYYEATRGYYDPEAAGDERDRLAICLAPTDGRVHAVGELRAALSPPVDLEGVRLRPRAGRHGARSCPRAGRS